MPIFKKQKSSKGAEPLKKSINISFWPTWAENKTFSLILVILFITIMSWLVVVIRNDLREFFYIGKTDQSVGSISVSGEGKVVGVPDIAEVNLGLNTQAKTVELAQKENTEKMNLLINSLKSLAIEEKDIKTENYNVYPVYDYTSREGRKLKGYSVSQSVKVKIRDMDKVSQVLAIAGEAGLNQVGGLDFIIDDPEELKVQARKKALLDAKEKAGDLASVLGVKVGRVMSFYESEIGSEYPKIARAYAEEMAMGGGVPIPEIEPGSQEVNITVTIEYEIIN